MRDGRLRLIVSTELAARGLDLPELTHVVNFDLPTDSQHYIHRAGMLLYVISDLEIYLSYSAVVYIKLFYTHSHCALYTTYLYCTNYIVLSH